MFTIVCIQKLAKPDSKILDPEKAMERLGELVTDGTIPSTSEKSSVINTVVNQLFEDIQP